MHGLVFETSICYWQDQPDSRFHGRTPASGPVSFLSHRRDLDGAQANRTGVRCSEARVVLRFSAGDRPFNPGQQTTVYESGSRRWFRQAESSTANPITQYSDHRLTESVRGHRSPIVRLTAKRKDDRRVRAEGESTAIKRRTRCFAKPT